MHHFRKTYQSYARHNKNDRADGDCPFPSCNPKNAKIQKPIFENQTMYIVNNRVSYDTFETLDVLDHLLLIPKRHVETLADLTEQEMLDMMRVIGNYEQRGYSVYARGVNSVHRSVQHQHTHLMRLKKQKAKLLFYVRKPYFVVKL